MTTEELQKDISDTLTQLEAKLARDTAVRILCVNNISHMMF